MGLPSGMTLLGKRYALASGKLGEVAVLIGIPPSADFAGLPFGMTLLGKRYALASF